MSDWEAAPVEGYFVEAPAWVGEWNERIREIDAEGPFYPPMAVHGKALPYVGWYWRDVDFHLSRVTLGDCRTFVGFMENNKWGYPQWYVEGAARERLLAVLHGWISGPTAETSRELYDFLQTRPGRA